MEEKLKLVIIESPAKRESLKKYLGPDYEVYATKGHIRDLPQKSFAIDLKNNFQPKYEILPDKKELIAGLKKKAEQADYVYIATDPDREGEAISWHVAYVLGYPADKKCRIQFNEISKKAVTKALEEPRAIDLNLVDAQQARRVMDRIVGYKLSPILCKKIAPKLSAGRVQSVALKLVVDREKEIEEFKPEEFWTVTATLEKSGQAFKASLDKKDKKKFVPKNKEEVDQALEKIKQGQFQIVELKKANTKSHAPAPFTTSTMQQDALNKLGMSLKRTSSAAQQLYEGVELKGEGKTALITYIRTDSVRISTDAQNACLDYIKRTYGDKFVPAKPNIYHTKESAQDAHEAIRPISMDRKPEDIKDSVASDNYRLYKLIYERFLASQMAEAEYASVTVNFDVNGYGFKASGKTMLFPGYTTAYKEYVDDDKNDGKETLAGKLPVMEEGEVIPCKEILPEQKFTKPPTRYTEASLVKAMEEKGIGRPATYAATITVLTSRTYCEKEGKYLVPTKLGRNVTDYLDQFFSSVINVKFTAHMEQRLDDIAEDKDEWQKVIEAFWDGFSVLLGKADASAVTMKAPPEETDIVCEKCGGKMLIREGRYGKFLGCANFPKCKNVQPLPEKAAEPKKYAGICPECGAKMTVRHSKRGKLYYSCERYPDCTCMTWDLPTGKKCPKCKSPIVQKGKVIKCSNKDCDYKEENPS